MSEAAQRKPAIKSKSSFPSQTPDTQPQPSAPSSKPSAPSPLSHYARVNPFALA